MVNENRLVEEFIELVSVDSESGQERQIADLLKKKLNQLGLEVKEDMAGDILKTGTGNLIATMPGNRDGVPTVFFSAHMDTVTPGKGIKPVLKDGVITSSGETILGGDDKAGIAAILETISIIKEKKLPHGTLQLIISVYEEGGLRGAKNLDLNMVKAEFGYVLDCDGPAGTIINKAPAQNNIKATIHGKAAHAGISPEEGINAIVIASDAITNMRLGRIDEETTANIGKISGGKATNIIPDRVIVEGEARSVDPAKLKEQTDHMCQCFVKAAQKHGTEAEVTWEQVYPNINLKADEPVMDIVVQAARNLGFTPIIKHTGGGSDANIYNGKGIPTANLGIGMSKVHSTEEFIKVNDMVQSAMYLLEIVNVVNQKKKD